MSNASGPTHTAFRYMTRFRCIGSACESSCCTGGWGITLDKEHYKITKQAMGGSYAGRQEFDAKIKLVKKSSRNDTRHALFVLQNNGDCSFLGQDRLCTLQRKYGEGVLSDTCSVYPRFMAQSGRRAELAGLTSCPEVARQLLLNDDAMDLVEVDPAAFTRPLFNRRVEDHPADPYTRYHDELRNLILDLLSLDKFPLTTRLSFVAYFAQRTQPFLNKQTTQLDEERLLAEVERIQNPELQLELHSQFEALSVDTSFPSRVVMTMLGQKHDSRMMRDLLRSIVKQYAATVGLKEIAIGENDVESTVQQVARAYGEHKARWAHAAAHIDRYLTNLMKNYWARDWYGESPDLLAHTVKLLARVAVVRFLLLGHPLLAASLTQNEAEQAAALDCAVVEVVQKFTRVFDHDASLRERLHSQLADANVLSLAHAVCLARF
jgi:lysine-N-methylase